MDNRKILLWVLIIIMGISVIGCRKKDGFKKLFSKEDEMEIIRSDDYDFEITEDDGMRKTVLYFRDKQGLLVPLMRKIPWEEGIAKSALNNMIDTAELRESLKYTGLNPIIPAGTEIRGMAVNEETGICKVDFTDEIMNYETEKEEENLIKGIVYTLTEFQAINEVEFLINGGMASFKFNADSSTPFKRENINLVGDVNDFNSKTVVYYKGNHFEEDYEYFVPVTIPTLAPVPNIYTAMETLFDGPSGDLGLESNIPDGTSFHGIDIKDGIAYVDISFDYGEPSKDSQVYSSMMKNIGLTLSEFGEIEKVELLIDGKSLAELGIDIYNMTIPAFANEY
jgi:germination protein M